MTQAYQLGTFVKTASPHIIEVLGTTKLDFVCIDAEHAPFDRATLDLMVLATRATHLKAFIRIAEVNPAVILSALDIGAAGILVPHVDSADDARNVVAMARYKGGARGYSSSPRFAGYGSLGMKEALRIGDEAQVICQIESDAAVKDAEAIAAVPGVGGLFVGRADLALSMGLDNPREPRVLEATRHVLAVARKAGIRAGMFVAGNAERDEFAALGADWFIVSSDQTLLRQGAQAIAHAA
ncbi:HpcH/HpaI aldolase family protein [Hydrogenophaga sp. BPS33]|uniref:HpcH/HpaI aldolase family protein n=1 Tax=Hydrogenophaga sp. BPS33 TaxID=2651974 RepID=UPI00131FF158|nr:aldolase/citrate lyase family protein [Hydrogenophaga sp. BPS33]QHE86528.1 aldolase [Hydrogenophaga sp. BPS33]